MLIRNKIYFTHHFPEFPMPLFICFLPGIKHFRITITNQNKNYINYDIFKKVADEYKTNTIYSIFKIDNFKTKKATAHLFSIKSLFYLI